jgi:8-oxo-dGTP pyrophosphatase MutT (NUDIX family)
MRARLDALERLSLHEPLRGDHDLNPDWGADWGQVPGATTPAAILAPIVKRPSGWTVLLTQRTNDTPAHPGQISFPGGRVQAGDADALAAALRETEEEIGLSRRVLEPIGAWDRYSTGSGFAITPIVALVEPGFELALDPREVAEVFETPLAFLMDPVNHETRQTEWQGRPRTYYAITHANREIWGVTAGLIRALYERLYR